MMEIIDRIEEIRGRNNKNWMDLLRLAFKYAPHEAAAVMAGIYAEDQEIARLIGMLADDKPVDRQPDRPMVSADQGDRDQAEA